MGETGRTIHLWNFEDWKIKICVSLHIQWLSIRFKPHPPREIQKYAGAPYSCHLCGKCYWHLFFGSGNIEHIPTCSRYWQNENLSWPKCCHLILKSLLGLIRDHKLLGYFLSKILGVLHRILSHIWCHVLTLFCKIDMLLEIAKIFAISLFRSVHIVYL